jgi:hypothetical protein
MRSLRRHLSSPQAARAGETALVPIYVRVQQLQSFLQSDPDTFAASGNWIEAFVQLEYANAPEAHRMLRQVSTY